MASFAAAAVSGGDPIRTGFVAFFYSLRTAILPFLFIFNTDLLLINVDWLQGIMVFVVSTAAILLFTAATQGYFVVRNRFYETALLILIAFSLFRPGYWMDMIAPPYQSVAASELVSGSLDIPAGAKLRLHLDGEDAVGNQRSFVALYTLGEGANTQERVVSSGLELLASNGKVVVDMVGFDSHAQKAGLSFDQEIVEVEVPQEQPYKELIFIPALLLLVPIVVLQRRRRDPDAEAKARARSASATI